MGDKDIYMLKEIYKEIYFAGYSIYKNLQSSMELRFSFWFAIFGMALNNVAFIIIWMSFGVIAGDMGGWQAVDYLLAFGIGTARPPMPFCAPPVG